MPVPVQRWWFENLAGQQEWFDFEPLRRTDVYGGKWPPHHDKALYALPSGRWVLGFVDGVGDTESRPGMPVDFSDIEVTPEFAVRWLDDNDHPMPDHLKHVANQVGGNPYQDPRVQRFYDACVVRKNEDATRSNWQPTIRVDHDEKLVFMAGNVFRLSDEKAAAFIEAVVEASKMPMPLVSFSEMKRKYPILEGGNSNRIYNSLPDKIRERIKSEGGKGYWLKREP
jgi:hypothetical protein